jgi:hypothetical protein
VTFFAHLLNLLSKRTFRATVRFAPIPSIDANRKELAQQLHSEMLKLKNATTGLKNPSPPATGHL